MAVLTWDETGKRLFETGVDRGVLYIPNAQGEYVNGYSWNGLTTVTESPSGAEDSPQYADNIKYLNLLSAEEFGATIEAFTYPEEFGQCDGTISPSAGVALGQQFRKSFGLAYRSKVGNDLAGPDHGFKLHLIYGALAAPSEKAYATINDSPEAITFSWEVTTSPVGVVGYKPVAQMVVDSTKVSAAAMTNLLNILYGTAAINPRLPLPSEVIGLFGGAVTQVRMTTSGPNAPTYSTASKVVTLPEVTGIQWRINGVNKNAGAQPALVAGETSVVTAVANPGYMINGEDTWVFDF